MAISVRLFHRIPGSISQYTRLLVFFCGLRIGQDAMVNELAAVDGRAERVEFFLVARHDADGAVLVQIASQVADLQPTGLKFAERPLEQRCVVRLEVDFAPHAQDAPIRRSTRW